jgi:hypothetical protein
LLRCHAGRAWLVDGATHSGRGNGKKARLLADRVDSPARSMGIDAASGSRGTAAAAQVEDAAWPANGKDGTASRLSRTWLRAICAGSRSAVRLMAAFQAINKRA